MKRTFVICAALAVSLAVLPLAGARNNFAPRQERFFRIGDKKTLVMVKDGKAAFEIVRGGTPAARYAAREAATVLGKAFGCTFKVLPKASGTVPALIIGDAALAAKNGIDLKKLDRDGFVIKTAGNSVIIAGRDDPKGDPLKSCYGYGVMFERGSLYGTYDFLERFLGARFYFPGEVGTVIPKLRDWALPSIDISDRPDFNQRRITYGTPDYCGIPGKVKAVNYQRLRLETMGIPNCHGLAFLQFIPRFAKTRPEYFALQTNGQRHFDTKAARPSSRYGQICFSSGIKQVILDDAEAFLKGKPASSRGITEWSWSRYPRMPYFNIMPNDSCYPCQCGKCKPHFDKGKQAGSDFIWDFFIDIAEEGLKRKLPGEFTTMAYANYREIPARKIPDNLLVMLAARGPWNELSPAVAEREMAVLRAWCAKLGGKTWLWTYPHKWGGAGIDGIPCVAPVAVGRFFRKCAPYIFGAYMEAETDYFIFSALNYYVFSRVAWDNKADVEAIVAEYNARMFGAAAPEMAEILTMLEKQWLTCAGNSVETPAGPVTRFPGQVELWSKFYTAAFVGKIDALLTKAERKVQNDKASLGRVRYMRKWLWEPLAAARNKWIKSVSSKEHWTAVMPEKAWSDTLFLLPMVSRGVMPEAEVRTQVRMKRDAEHFYFEFDCGEPRTDAMITPRRPRDYPRIWEDPTVEVQLDPAGEGKVRYQFIISAAGDVTDIKYVNGLPNLRWSTDCKVKSVITPGKGYTVSLTIPRKDMDAAVPGKFRANFNRYRALKGVSVQPFYTWSYFVRNFGDLENFGIILFDGKEPPQQIRDGDFRSPIRGRFAGPWASTKPLVKDPKTFVFGGESMLLKDGQMLVQYLKKENFKPGREYVLSFWVRVSAGMEFNVRFDEGSGYVQMFPRIPVRGPQEWIRQEFRFRINENFGGKRGAYLRFQPNGKAGSVWLNKVRLYEVPAK